MKNGGSSACDDDLPWDEWATLGMGGIGSCHTLTDAPPLDGPFSRPKKVPHRPIGFLANIDEVEYR